MKKEKRPFWVFPWGYRESFAVVITVAISGFALSFILQKEVSAPTWPNNIITGVILVAAILLFHIFFPKHSFVKWLSGSYAAISSISFYLFLIILMGFIPQNSNNSLEILNGSGLSHITSSHIFLFAQIYMFLVLGLVTLRRLERFSTRNIFFFLNHFGLWLTLFAAGMGSSDIKRFTMEINKNEPSFQGINSKGESSGDLGLALQLEEFSIEHYSPKAFIINAKTGDIMSENQIFSLEKNAKGNLGEWQIAVKDFIEYGIGMGEKFHAVYDIGAAPAAYVEAKHSSGNIVEGWISCGSFRFPGNFLELSEEKLLIMAEPEAKSYLSKIKIYTKEGEVYLADLSVGRPVSINGWKIYQISYDESKGKWSEISIVELVKDPWLWLVYAGLIMLIAGAVYLIITGSRTKNSEL
ncbi:MAG: hypothetical protein JXR58_11960 [Bacteroidales bacterium]|nr:hypothetical protein [Bacteroidales bacterium]